MAQISSPFVGIAKGKLGEGVYYRAGGKTLARARNRQPRNPKSTAQCQQRLVFSSATRTAKVLREIIDHSFEGIEYGQKSVNHFTQQAVGVLKRHMQSPIMDGVTPYVPALPLGSLTGNGVEMVLAEFPMSQGSLEPIPAQLIETSADGVQGTHGLRIGAAGIASATKTLANLAEFGFERGKQYTFILIYAHRTKSDGKFDFNVPGGIEIARINFSADAAETTPLFLAAGGEGNFTINPAVLNIETSTNYSAVHFMVDADAFPGTAIVDGGGDIIAGCVIASEYVNGQWRRSSQVLLTLVADVEGLDPMDVSVIRNGICWNSLTDLLNSIVGEGAYASDWYLNQSPNA